MTESHISKISKAVGISKNYSIDEIESSVIGYYCSSTNKDFTYSGNLERLQGKESKELIALFSNIEFPVNLEFIIEYFEALLDADNIVENGIVFTPKYIADYISEKVIESHPFAKNAKAIDPGCGCGIFLVSFAELLSTKLDIPMSEIVSKYIFGIDIDEDNIRRCEIVLNLLVLEYDNDNANVNTNLRCVDSLKCCWNDEFGVDAFEYIIGNPPYVNTHDMSKETAKFLKSTFVTTKTGVYNIFYAFIEHALEFLDVDGALSYIVPNNFLSIKSATDLRKYIAERHYLESVIDFADNMVFKPVRTYNCIIRLSKNEKDSFEYCVLEKGDDIPKLLDCAEFDRMELNKLDVNGWKLVDKVTMSNIKKIESQFRPIKEFVRTGIATLRDNVFIVESDNHGYYKIVDGKRYDIEADLVKRLYKIPDLKGCEDVEQVVRYIIFPYKKSGSGFSIISEDWLQENVPHTYQYLLSQKDELDTRDKGKPNPVAWYAYGRTQGLSKYGRKLVFPTFALKPRFTMVEDEFALFCNGYAVFDNDYLDLEVLQRILNSEVMQYYVSNTSYAIEGGYFCYQKKYIEKFSLPFFKAEELEQIQRMDDSEFNNYLIARYDITI
ncbi:Eco57I restriction-modification methylase domain-containing protein [Kandleria vitulina]|uniref:Eco57I restriction-modification methylase domain-containing protein n=1 Tax=Kandleria vitulina TaxID=1630 RepID=UPI0004909538|nr:N-6 DNA methylase [Kandleria vitulina]